MSCISSSRACLLPRSRGVGGPRGLKRSIVLSAVKNKNRGRKPDETCSNVTNCCVFDRIPPANTIRIGSRRSEEHTSELQSHVNLVCRLLLEKKKNKKRHTI